MADFNRFEPGSDFADLIGRQGNPDLTKYNCPLCEDSGVIVDSNGNLHACKCWQEKRRQAALRRSGLPPALAKLSFADFDFSYYPDNRIADENRQLSYYACAKKAFDAAYGFAQAAKIKPPVGGLMFQGPVGSGKTHLAAAICNELLSAGQAVRFAVVPEFLDELRSVYGGSSDFDEVQLMNRVQTAPVLILDDLGAHNFSDWTKNKLFAILNYRLNHELPCVITTNLPPAGLQEILGERILSRLVAACDIYLLPVEQDIRLLKSRSK